MRTFTTQEMKEFVEFWEKAKKSYNFNSKLEFDQALKEIYDLDYWQKNRVVDGYIITAPTTPSSQGSGAVRATWRINYSGGVLVSGGVLAWVATTTNSTTTFNLNTAPILEVGQSVVLAALASCRNDRSFTPRFGVWGTPAATGQEQPPTQDQISAGLAATLTGAFGYVRIALLTLNRTGDTTVTQSVDNTWRDV